MVGDNRNKWLASQLGRLKWLIENGTSWNDAAIAVGHPVQSCRTKLSQMRAAERQAEREKPGEIARSAPRAPATEPERTLPQQSTAPATRRRITPTAKLVTDAEMRSRIELQGVTAGLLGDPLPGRSALDLKLQSTPTPATGESHASHY